MRPCPLTWALVGHKLASRGPSREHLGRWAIRPSASLARVARCEDAGGAVYGAERLEGGGRAGADGQREAALVTRVEGGEAPEERPVQHVAPGRRGGGVGEGAAVRGEAEGAKCARVGGSGVRESVDEHQLCGRY